ncbi:MAG: carbon-nitrogen hydrolase family protein [bacterium]
MIKQVLGGRDKVRVAAVQAAPVFLDKEKTLEKACRLIREAGANGAELIVFPEAFVPAYPAFYTGGFELPVAEWAAYNVTLQENSVVIPSEDTRILGEAARQAGSYVVVGLNELDDRPGSRTLFNTLLYLDKRGEVLGRHRKLMPTYTERTYWGWGDGSDLKVFDSGIGRIGGLICWEHHMILVRAAMIHLGEELHASVWPGSWRFAGPRVSEPETAPLGGSCDLQPAIREHAFEAGAFVISVSGLLREEDFPEPWRHLTASSHMNYSWAVGGSAIVSPMGGYLVEPVFHEETILYADCEANLLKAVKVVFDALGHYSRWDVVRLDVRREPWTPEVPAREPAWPRADLPFAELRRISEQFEVRLQKLEKLMEELSRAR